jgi:hypothetical protein
MHILAENRAIQQTMNRKAKAPARSHARHSHNIKAILHLQRMIGNQVAQRVFPKNLRVKACLVSVAAFWRRTCHYTARRLRAQHYTSYTCARWRLENPILGQ